MQKKIRSIIVDDEKDSRETLRNYLSSYCPQIELLDECADIIGARASILKHKPDLIFLDIEMPRGNAFDLLEQWGEINFEIIFVTAFSQYAVQAFNLSAAQYLLKPVDISELESAVEIVEKSINDKLSISRAKILLENLAIQNSQNRKLVLPLMEGFDVVRMSEVMYCEAEDNFTHFHLSDGRKSLICRSLKFYESTLEPFGFCRVHRSHIVNLEYIKKYHKGNGGSIFLENGKEINVSKNKKAEFLRRIGSSLSSD